MSPRSATGRRTRTPRDQGVVALEYVAILPVALLVIAIAIQMIVGVTTAQSTSDAARQAARAYSLGEDPRAAAQDALSGRMRITSFSAHGPEHAVTLTVAVPTLNGLFHWTVTRTAVMP